MASYLPTDGYRVRDTKKRSPIHILILGMIVGVLANSVFTALTTGKIEITGTLTVISWLNARLPLCIIIIMPIVILTLCSFLAHHKRQRATQENQHVYSESLIVVA